MLKKDVIIAQAVLSGLTDEQIKAIETLSENDENKVISDRFGIVYREFDQKIVDHLGIKREGDEKTYNYFERAAKIVKSEADKVKDLETKFEEITKEKARLEKVISEGKNDEETAKKLKQAETDLAATKAQFTTLQKEFEEVKGKHENDLLQYKKDGVFNSALSELKLKAEFPKELLDTAIEKATAKVKGLPSEFVTTGGKETLIFRNEKGETLTNKENSLNPFTAGELLKAELKALGVLDEGRKQNGAGSNPGSTGGEGSTLDISNAKTRVEAHKVIENSLLQQGLTKGSIEFQTAVDKAWIDNKVADLPQE